MASITTRQTAGTGATVKNSPLTNSELDTNFININTDLGNAAYITGSYSNPSWITSLSETKVLPNQSGNSGKYLTTNGTATSWATVTLPSGQTSGSATAGYLQYSGTTKTSGQLDGGTVAPTNTTRLNYDGYLYATRFYGDGSQLTGITASSIFVPPRVATVADTASIQPNSSTTDQYNVTALAQAVTVNIPTGAPVHGQKLIIRIKDNGTSRTLTWSTGAGGYRIIGTVLPTATTINKTMYIGCIYNSTDSFWDVVAATTEA